MRSARNNITYRVAFSGRASDLPQGDIESRLTQAEIDADTSATGSANEGISTSPKKTDGQGMSSERDPIFSSSISDESSGSKMSEVASAVTSIVSETLKKGDKEKIVESSDSKEGSSEVSTSSTETRYELGFKLMDSAEIRRRKHLWSFGDSSGQSSTTQSSDEDSTKKD